MASMKPYNRSEDPDPHPHDGQPCVCHLLTPKGYPRHRGQVTPVVFNRHVDRILGGS